MNRNKILTCLFASLIVMAIPFQASWAASTQSKKTSSANKSTTTKQSSSGKKSATTSSASHSASKSHSSKNGKSSGKTASPSSSNHCKTIKIKSGKGYKYKKECSSVASESARNTAPREPVLTGGVPTPLPADAPVPEVKARSTPDRAYAVDGSTFFYQGRKFHVTGVNSENVDTNSDLAKQKLQMALDKGSISTESMAIDDAGVTNAVVRINGRNLSDMLKTPE